ncbi:MAG: succinate dehydrogenase, hydrophobic membrane anchor protein [Desulfobacteraceae bacterium]|jgi:succinate dehydrogenase hydrophobic membrane anchor protein
MAFQANMISMLEKFPKISFYARTRGWHFILAWCHRITGILLVIFVWIHMYFFSSPYETGAHEMGAQGLGSLIAALSQWILAVPIIFHAFNGGRLILYEIYGNRAEESMLRWMTGLGVIYLAVLGLIMLMGNQSASPFIFWLVMIAGAAILSYGVGARIWRGGHSIFWRLQRISATFLLVMIPAYILFMHLAPVGSEETGMAMLGMQKHFIQAVYLLLLAGTLYHAGYGIWSLVSDYLSSRTLRRGLALLVTLLMLVSSWVGVTMIRSI